MEKIDKEKIINISDRLINKKIKEHSEFLRFSYYEVMIKNEIRNEEQTTFLDLTRNKLINLGYNVYFTGARYEYQRASQTVQDNELIIAIKDSIKY